MFVPTLREAPGQAKARSHALLCRAGFIQQGAAGMYRLLPLGQRVLARLEVLVDKELQSDPIGAEKVRLPLLTDAALWKRSGRLDAYGPELARLKDRKGHDFCVGPTFEEEMTDLVSSFGALTPKRLPVKLYQVTSKFRDELRPRFGLLRGREFVMKDMYSFHETEACARRTYADVCAAYERILGALRLDFAKVLAASGAMGGDHTHEFQVLADVGEDELICCGAGDFVANVEVAGDGQRAGASCAAPGCSCGGGGTLEAKRGIEVAQAFLLGDQYAKAFGAVSQGPRGKRTPVFMACFGVGMSRLMAAAVESDRGHDESGIIWPAAIAPHDVVVLTGPGNAQARAAYEEAAGDVARALSAGGLDVVLDDRWKDSFGAKLAEAKLIGIPHIVVVGKSWTTDGLVEVHRRGRDEDPVLLKPASVLARVEGTSDADTLTIASQESKPIG